VLARCLLRSAEGRTSVSRLSIGVVNHPVPQVPAPSWLWQAAKERQAKTRLTMSTGIAWARRAVPSAGSLGRAFRARETQRSCVEEIQELWKVDEPPNSPVRVRRMSHERR